MDRYQRFGNKAEQAAQNVKRSPRHSKVSLQVLVCEDCGGELHVTHPAHLGARCRWCWDALSGSTEGVSYA